MIKHDLGLVPPGELCFEIFVSLVLKLLVFLSYEKSLLTLSERLFLNLETEASRRRYRLSLIFLKTSHVNSFNIGAKLILHQNGVCEGQRLDNITVLFIIFKSESVLTAKSRLINLLAWQ